MTPNTIAAPSDTATKAVEYRAKSTEDKKGSLGTQRSDNRGMAERESWRVVDEFEDEGFSGFKRSRGPGLEAAKAEAARIAAEEGTCVLVVQHTDRLARGAGNAPGAADHLAEVFFWAKRHNVQLRSVQDDSNLDDAIRAVLIGERNTEDSARKSKAVSGGKRRQLERGERLGGPVPEGYELTVKRNAADEVIARVYTFDPDREPLIRRIFDLALAGVPDTGLARQLNAEGYRTKIRTIKTGERKGHAEGGVPWTRRRVQAVLLNPFYSGRISGTIDGEPVVVEGEQPGYVTPTEQDGLIAARQQRDLNQRGHAKVGAPTRNHMLDGGEKGLAGCLRCGGSMYAGTSNYRRKSDGGRARTLMCLNVKGGTGLCDAPTIRAERIEAALIDHLDGMFVDFQGWISAQTEQRAGASRVLESDLDAERQVRGEAERKEALLAARYAEHVDTDETLAAADAAAMKQQGESRERADRRIADLQALLAEATQPEPVDAALDWFNSLAASVRGATAGTELREVNEGLRQTFNRFWMDTNEDGDVEIVPELLPDLRVRLVPGDEGVHLAAGQFMVADDEGNFRPVPDDVTIPPELLAYMRPNPKPIPVLVGPERKESDGQE